MAEKWRLALQAPFGEENQDDPFSNRSVNGCERHRNEKAHCKTDFEAKNETAAQAGTPNGGKAGYHGSSIDAKHITVRAIDAITASLIGRDVFVVHSRATR